MGWSSSLQLFLGRAVRLGWAIWAWLLSNAPPNRPPTFIDSKILDIMDVLLAKCLMLHMSAKQKEKYMSLGCAFVWSKVVAEITQTGMHDQPLHWDWGSGGWEIALLRCCNL